MKNKNSLKAGGATEFAFVKSLLIYNLMRKNSHNIMIYVCSLDRGLYEIDNKN